MLCGCAANIFPLVRTVKQNSHPLERFLWFLLNAATGQTTVHRRRVKIIA